MKKHLCGRLFLIVVYCCLSLWAGGAQNEMNMFVRAEAKGSSKAILDESLVEGNNRIVFADTPEKLAEYVPKTRWREKENSAKEEDCKFSVIAVSEGMDEKKIVRFLAGDLGGLRMGKGDWFLLDLRNPYWLSEIGMETKGKITAKVTDKFGKNSFMNLTFPTANPVAFDAPVLCKYLLVKATDEGKPVELQQLNAKGKPVFASQVTRANKGGESPIVLGAKDLSNPLSVWRRPLRKSHYQLAKALLEGAKGLSDHEKIMVFMDYISDYYIGRISTKLEFEEYIGACGAYSNLLAALACTQKIPARIVSLGNYPENNGHAVCEVYYDKKWHLYDPTYGAYYTTTPATETEHPYVLGFEELSLGRGNHPGVSCVVTAPHRLISKAAYSFLGPHIYEAANPRGPIGPDRPFVYPLAMEAAANGSAVLTEKDFSGRYQGIRYIGVSGINNLHEWTLRKLVKGEAYEFVVSAKSVGGEKKEPFLAKAASANAKITEGSEHGFLSGDKSSYVWKICFVPETDEAKIMLTHDFRGPELHYVMFSSFELHCAE